MSTADTLGDPSAQLIWLVRASFWANLLWPVVVTGAIAIAKRKQLVRPRLFVFIGSLSCFGVAFLVGQLSAYWRVRLAASTLSDHLLAAVAGSLLGVLVSSVLLSCVPLVYLYRACSVPVSTSNNRWRGP